MAHSTVADVALHPAFTTKQQLIDAIRKECHNSPATSDFLLRIAYTDLALLTLKDTVTPTSFGL